MIMKTPHIHNFFNDVKSIAEKIDKDEIQKLAQNINDVRKKKGRLFFLGVGGSASNCSHAVNDFRKIIGVESYAPTDNVSELTARTNDEGWNTIWWMDGASIIAKTGDVQAFTNYCHI
jgi:D-sedoheptulose 7-phosphate isomerase